MAWKVIAFFAIFALSEARPPTSEQRVKIENWLSHTESHKPESHEVYASAYPHYEFTYEVSDPHTHDFKGHHEERKGDDVKGYYWLIQPDGLKRTVKYRVDKHSGFKAHVDYTKHWEAEKKKQEGEANEENNTGENENSETEENENDQENENEGEGEEETENNESGVEEETENREEQEEESENQENWYHKKSHLSIGNHGRRDKEQKSHGRKLKATVGIWRPNLYTKRHHNEELRHVRSEQKNEKKGKNIGRGDKGKNKKSEQNQENYNNEKQQSNEGNENSEGNEGNHKGISKKTEYHIVIHHPKHH